MSASLKSHGARTGEFWTFCILVFWAELMSESGGIELLLLLTLESDLLSLLILELVLGAGLTGDGDDGNVLPLLTVRLVTDDDDVELLPLGLFLDVEVSIPNASCALSDTH
ncbi:hypothetical protein INT47_006839 [Mucor saturninus]|uniref:Uncharacterized protein n=1 Tax=Mucor saturninus TaxID=64648 RepID=A0A8H7V4Z2_9FUNG|nr:hypothetical protein INT47_006839 [Mucor saturninus]